MILPDVNMLIYAFRRESPRHEEYAQWLAETVAANEVALVESVLTGFLRIVTHRRIYADPAPMVDALAFVTALRAAPKARTLAATAATWERMRSIVRTDPQVRGPLDPDAWLAAMALSHGCRLATADRGSARYSRLDYFDPVSAE